MHRALLILSAAAVYAVTFWPSRQVTTAGLIALGRPEYVGFTGMFLPHLLLYSTLTAGIVALIATVVVYVLFPPNTVHWIDPVAVEDCRERLLEFLRGVRVPGFLLVALGAAIGFWPAAIISSAMWGYTHNQYPLSLQALIMAVGVYFSC